MKLHDQVLLSRLLTRSGDQAWDFALPVTLVMLFPDRFALIAGIFLMTKMGQFLFQPAVSGIIDRWRRSHTAYFGTSLQLFSVVSAAACLFGLLELQRHSNPALLHSVQWLLIAGVVVSSILSALGAAVMEISVGNDWVPTLVPASDLAHVNSRLKQVDLLTEVVSPVVAGLLLGLSSLAEPLFGFFLVVLWNVLSFGPEIFLLRRVFNRAGALQQMTPTTARVGLLRTTLDGWRDFRKHSAAPVMLAYAMLWLSALSPHGVLLTSFLKGGWQMSEFVLGLFRAGGAVFGLLATLVFPVVVRQVGVIRGALVFIVLQALSLLVAFVFFSTRAGDGLVFLGFVLLSRIGLYGFSLGEMEIRQRTIAPGERGKIGGVASALTSFATLLLFGAGTFVPSHEAFVWIVGQSVAAVCGAAWIYLRWSRHQVKGVQAF